MGKKFSEKLKKFLRKFEKNSWKNRKKFLEKS